LAEHIALMRKKRNVYRVLAGKCIQGFGGEILGKETTWKTQTYM